MQPKPFLTVLKHSKALLKWDIPCLTIPAVENFFLPFASGAYVLRYRLERPDTVVIIRVWHSREKRN